LTIMLVRERLGQVLGAVDNHLAMGHANGHQGVRLADLTRRDVIVRNRADSRLASGGHRRPNQGGFPGCLGVCSHAICLANRADIDDRAPTPMAGRSTQFAA
jgi:hypothetical protein